jgi:hypothetical protein
MRVRASIGRAALATLVAGGLVAGAACSGDDDSSEDTLAVIPPGSSTTGPVTPGQPGASTPTGTALDPAQAGSGFVSLDVQVASAGIAETISLDRASLPATALDPVSLNAACSPLDGAGPDGGVVVSVVDLRRLAGNRLVSAVLRYGDAAPGEHDMTLELGSAEQVTTVYTGRVEVATDGLAGTFDGADSAGTPVTGSFVCASEAIVTTTTAVPLDAGEEVPDDGSVPPPVSTVAPG